MSSQRSYLQRQVVWLGALDAFCLMLGMIAAIIIRMGPESLSEYVITYVSGWLYLTIAVLISNFVTGSYGLELKLSRFNMIVNWAFSVTMAFLVVSITSYAWLNIVLGRGVLVLTVVIYSGLWLTLRLIIYHYFFRKDAFAYRVAILGAGARARSDAALIQNVNLRPKHTVVAMIQLEREDHGMAAEAAGDRKEGRLVHCIPGRLAQTVRALACDVLLVAVDQEDELAGVHSQLRRLKYEGVSVLSPLNVAEVYGGKIPLNLVDENWLMHASQGFISPMTIRLKRIVDILLVVLVSPLALLLALGVAIAVKLSGLSEPVFYSQERVGRFGRHFRIHKFRTMKEGAEQVQGAVWASQDDPRVTWVGKSLRKYRLDEVPQLWNILKGEMSLVGPRPERPELVAKLEKVIPYFRERENLPPGLTGWAQIRYPYGATIEDARAKLEFDLYYLQSFSAALDLRIILSTLRIVFFGMERDVR
ncbi:MAG: exopolysaccharide biosynthesis polyprenyl glycosylphosphotransferase [bacterium]